MNRNLVWLAARTAALALALAAFGAAACTGGGGDETQSIEGQVARSNFDSTVLGVRAVRGGEAVAWAPLTDNGHFRLRVPVGEDYRLEVVTSSGAHPFVGRTGDAGRNLVFDVCAAGGAYDVGHVHGWDESSDPGEEDGGGGCDDPCMDNPEGCQDPCQTDPDSCDPCRDDPDNCDPCIEDPSLCEDPCMKDPTLCEDPCQTDPDSCQDPCREDPSLCEPTCDDQGNCCYPDGTCCDASGTCCYPDGTCCGFEGCCYPDGTCDPPPCDPSDPDGDCYCNEQDPASECYCNPDDPESYCYCREDDPNSYCYCNPEDPNSYCYPQPCENPDGTMCCPDDNGGGEDPTCWPEPDEPPPCDDGTMDENCWARGAVPDNGLPDFGCGGR
jgi:hypothetical protein